MLHPTYMPFTEDRLKKHFAPVKVGGTCVPACEKHLAYYKTSLENYAKCPASGDGKGKPLRALKTPCQTEKDERFWTAASLMTLFYSKNRQAELTRLFQKAYGEVPPCTGIRSWRDCFDGGLHLYFETNLPSPKSYKEWLLDNLGDRQFIPYILDSARGKKILEGPTHADAILLNERNGFAVVIEAKVLSDISCQITYDVSRNQIARNIDVMLEENDSLWPPLNLRDPERTLFLLLTPGIFQENRASRFYGCKFDEYRNDPGALRRDLPHRTDDFDWENLSMRLGWLTWEDFRDVNGDCCKWLE